MAQQRNIDVTATVIEFAHIIKNRRNLDALLLLTLADGQGTSGQNWSDWKESLVWQLYDVTTRYLADQKSYLEQIKIERDELQKAVAARLSPDYADDVEAHFDLMPDSYFRASELPDIVRDLKVVRTFFVNATSDGDQTLNPALHWQASPDQGHSIVSICSWDRQQLLAKIAGSFSIVPLNISERGRVYAGGQHRSRHFSGLRHDGRGSDGSKTNAAGGRDASPGAQGNEL